MRGAYSEVRNGNVALPPQEAGRGPFRLLEPRVSVCRTGKLVAHSFGRVPAMLFDDRSKDTSAASEKLAAVNVGTMV